MSEEAVYREFIEWFGRGWPLPESDELLPLMKARFSPEEAAFLTGMPHGLTPLEKLAEEREVDAAQLEKQLDALARQGVVYRQASDGERCRTDHRVIHLRLRHRAEGPARLLSEVRAVSRHYIGLQDVGVRMHLPPPRVSVAPAVPEGKLT